MIFIINFIGYLFLWEAVNAGRNEDSKIKLISGTWWFILITIYIGVLILNNTSNIINLLNKI